VKEALLEALKRAAAVLEAERIPYLVGGGMGCWARGGPPTSNDIDLIFEPAGIRVTDDVLERGEELNVGGMQVPVMAIDDIMVTKLLALDEHNADYPGLISIARSLREQIEWEALRERTASSPFGRAFFVIADGLGISAGAEQPAR
jgi:hypothetical protein